MKREIELGLSEQQAEQLLEQLSPTAKLHLVRRWEQETWPVRFRQLLARIDRTVQQNPRWAREALKAVGPARRAFYARRRRH